MAVWTWTLEFNGTTVLTTLFLNWNIKPAFDLPFPLQCSREGYQRKPTQMNPLKTHGTSKDWLLQKLAVCRDSGALMIDLF